MNSSVASVMTLVPLAALAAVVLPAEGDAVLVEGDQAAVRDGDAVGVAGRDRRAPPRARRTGAWRRRPSRLCAAAPDARRRPRASARPAMIAEELQPAGRVGGGEPRQEQPAEQAREHAHRQEEAGPARYPALAVERDAAARHDHVDVRMVGHRRAPGVEHGGDADAGAEVLGIGGDRESASRPRPGTAGRRSTALFW